MKLRQIAVVAAATGALLAVGAPAQAAPSTAAAKPAAAAPSTFIKAVGVVAVDPRNHRVGYVPSVYRCTGTGTLWASVKQVANRSRDPRLLAEGSSAISTAWSDSHRNTVNCDGRVHFAIFTVDQLEPYFTANGPTGQKSDIYGPLKRGWGYVQLCLFDAQYTEEPASHMLFKRVISPGFRH
jgi:hypothetical protein